jgi:hypothetical protein
VLARVYIQANLGGRTAEVLGSTPQEFQDLRKQVDELKIAIENKNDVVFSDDGSFAAEVADKLLYMQGANQPVWMTDSMGKPLA